MGYEFLLIAEPSEEPQLPMGVDDLVGSSELHSTSEPRSVKIGGRSR